MSTAATQKRRVMSRSSGFSSCVAVTVRGSRAMPQMGQRTGGGTHDLGMHGAGVFRARGGNRYVGFEGHAAGGASSGLEFADFRAHGADVGGWASGFRLSDFSRGLRSGRGHSQRYQARRGGFVQIRLRIGFEFFDATGAAEVVIFSAVFVDVFGGCGIDIHSADGVALGRWGEGCHRCRTVRRPEMSFFRPSRAGFVFLFTYPRLALWAAFLRRSAAVPFVMVLCVGSWMLYIGFIRRNGRDFRIIIPKG